MRAQALSLLAVAALAGGPLTAAPAAAQQDTPQVEKATPADGVIWRAEDLLGRTIRNAKGENLGTIDDLLINSDLSVVHVLVDVGGVLGVGDEQVAIALHEMTLTPEDTLVLDTTPAELAERPQYRFPDSPTTGSVRPGAPMPQTAAGIGFPGQAPQYMPGTTGVSEERRQRAALAGDSVRDTPLGAILRRDPSCPQAGDGDGDGAAGYDNRERYLQTASRSLKDFGQRLSGQRDTPGKASLMEKYTTATQRLESLQAASEEAWPTVLENFRVSVAQLQDNWQQAQAGGANPAPAEDARPAD